MKRKEKAVEVDKRGVIILLIMGLIFLIPLIMFINGDLKEKAELKDLEYLIFNTKICEEINSPASNYTLYRKDMVSINDKQYNINKLRYLCKRL